MKLSLAPISLDRYFDTDKDMRTILELTRDCGFTYIDYDIKQKYLEGDYIEHAERLKKNLAELGMTAAQAHAPIINPMNPGEVDYMIPTLAITDGVQMITSTSVQPPLIFSMYSSRPT